MKTLGIGLCGLVMFVAFGCSGSATKDSRATAATEQPAEPVRTVVNKPIIGEADKPIIGEADKPIIGEADETFSLSVPFESVSVTQGEEKSVLIGINRGENFREQVAIKLSGLPEGVTLETSDPVIEHGSTDATLMLKAAGDAALGDFTIKVIGHTASSGADFTKEFKMTVAQK